MRIKVTAIYEPEPDEADSGHEFGLTNEAWEKLTLRLNDLGLMDVETQKID